MLTDLLAWDIYFKNQDWSILRENIKFPLAQKEVFHIEMRVECSSMVECPLMVWFVVGSILPGGPIKLFLIPVSAPQLV